METETDNTQYANESLCDDVDAIQVFQSSEVVESVQLLLLSAEQKRIGLNKYVGQMKLDVISKVNSGLDERINSLQLQLAEEAKAAEQLIKRDFRIDMYETRRLKEKAKNTSDTVNILDEAFENLTKKNNRGRNCINELTNDLKDVMGLMAKDKQLRNELAELKEKRRVQRANSAYFVVNPHVVEENLHLKRELAERAKLLAHLRGEKDELKAYTANNNNQLQAGLKQLEEKSVALNVQLEGKRSLLAEQKDKRLRAEESLNQRLNELSIQNQEAKEKNHKLLTDIDESKAALWQQSEQLQLREKELKDVESQNEEVKQQCSADEQLCTEKLNVAKENLRLVEHEFEEKIKEKQDMETEVQSMKEEHFSLITEKHAAVVQNLEAQNVVLEHEKQFDRLHIQNQFIKEKLQKSQDILREGKLKTEILDDQLVGKRLLYENLEVDSEKQLNRIRMDHETIMNNLQQRREYALASRNFLDDKIKNITQETEKLKQQIHGLEEKENVEKAEYETKKQELNALKQKFENDKQTLYKLKHEKNAKIVKPSITKDNASPVSILKSPKAIKIPKTPPKSVKFLGVSDSESSIERELGNSQGNGAIEYRDPFDELIKALEQKRNTSMESVGSKKRKLDF